MENQTKDHQVDCSQTLRLGRRQHWSAKHRVTSFGWRLGGSHAETSHGIHQRGVPTEDSYLRDMYFVSKVWWNLLLGATAVFHHLREGSSNLLSGGPFKFGGHLLRMTLC